LPDVLLLCSYNARAAHLNTLTPTIRANTAAAIAAEPVAAVAILASASVILIFLFVNIGGLDTHAGNKADCPDRYDCSG
jgi:hypothetical protein